MAFIQCRMRDPLVLGLALRLPGRGLIGVISRGFKPDPG